MGMFVAYYRVSTQKQDYGLTAQRQAVLDFLSSRGGTLHSEFSEKESGKNNHRPELEKAISCAKINNATLLIAKLDRLSRNISFLFKLYIILFIKFLKYILSTAKLAYSKESSTAIPV